MTLLRRTTPTTSTLLDFKELLAHYPTLKGWTVRTYCSQRKIPHIKIGRKVFFRVADIERWLDQHARPVGEVSQ